MPDYYIGGTVQRGHESFKLDLDDDYRYDATRTQTGGGAARSVTTRNISRTPQRSAARVPAKSQNTGLWSLVKWLLVIVVIYFGYQYYMNNMVTEAVDVTMYADVRADLVESGLGVTFKDDREMAGEIVQFSGNKVSVKGNGEIGVVSINGIRKGLFVNSSAYTLYGVKIGDKEVSVERNTTFAFDNKTFDIGDKAQGDSVTVFYFNVKNNECLAVTYNNSSNRVINMAYYNDYETITDKIEH